MIMELEKKFENIKVGDQVVIERYFGTGYDVRTVTKVTKLYFDAGHQRFNKSDGAQTGTSPFGRCYAHEATPELIAQVEEEKLRANLVTFLTRTCKYSDVPISTLVEVCNMLRNKKDETGT